MDEVVEVLLADGHAALMRPITPDDADLLVAFYGRVSDESKYLRFFAPYPQLSRSDIERFTAVDGRDRVALIVLVSGRMIGVGRYERLNDADAEVAFLVEDAHQGRGIAQLLLEHLADIARRNGVATFVAEILPENTRMARTFSDAGYRVTRTFDDGLIVVEFGLQPTDTAVGIMQRREHEAEATSVRRLVAPRALAVTGGAEGVRALVDSLHRGGWSGELWVATEPGTETGTEPGTDDSSRALVAAGVSRERIVAALGDVTGRLDLVVCTEDAPAVSTTVIEAAYRGAHAVVILGEADASPGGLVGVVRAYGLRGLGPDSLGLINTDPEVALNASRAPMPRTGVIGVYCQSSAIGMMVISTAVRRRLGLSTMVSTGSVSDVSANDVMQFWEDDPRTLVCVMWLDRVGNSRKFFRIVRRLARHKPVVMFAPVRSSLAAHAHRNAGTEAATAVLRQAGVIVLDRRDALHGVAQLLARQPLPGPGPVAVVSNAPALTAQMERYAQRVGLRLRAPRVLTGVLGGDDIAAAVGDCLGETEGVDETEGVEEVGAVLVAVADAQGDLATESVARLRELARTSRVPVVAVIMGFRPLREVMGEPKGMAAPAEEPDGPGLLPVYDTYAEAMQSLATVAGYASWRAAEDGAVPLWEHDVSRARRVLRAVLNAEPEGRALTDAEAAEVLDAYAIPHRWAEDEPTSPAADDEPGVDLVVTARDDEVVGPVVSLSLEGLARDLFGDVVHRAPPLTTTDAREMVRQLRAAPLLLGETDRSERLPVAALEDLLLRVAQLADDLPHLAQAEFAPCRLSEFGVVVRRARLVCAPASSERESLSRSLRS